MSVVISKEYRLQYLRESHVLEHFNSLAILWYFDLFIISQMRNLD